MHIATSEHPNSCKRDSAAVSGQSIPPSNHHSNSQKPTQQVIGQWVFGLGWDWLGWEPLSAAVCQSGMIALYPVRSDELEIKEAGEMYSMVGITTSKDTYHYVLIAYTGLTGSDWQTTVINKA